MKLYILLLAIIATALAAEQFSHCKCQEGYEPRRNRHGEMSCFGIINRSVMPCNVPRRPKCLCGPGVTGIIHEDTGVWCGTFELGHEVRRWRCENRGEWDEYYRRNPGERPSGRSI